METSAAINELAGALAKAQGEIKGATKDATNPHFQSKYATLDAVWEACRVALSSNGLAVVQGAHATGGELVTVTTMLLHTSGQWIRESLDLVPKDASPQAAGSALTYARRYGLSSMVGVAPEDDDDANAAQGAARTFPPPQQVKPWYRRPPKEGPPLSTDPKVIDAEEEQIFGKKDGGAAPEPGLLDQLPDAFKHDRYALEMATARLMQSRQVTTAEKIALSISFLANKDVPNSSPVDLAKLYIFLNDPASVSDWRKELAKRQGGKA